MQFNNDGSRNMNTYICPMSDYYPCKYSEMTSEPIKENGVLAVIFKISCTCRARDKYEGCLLYGEEYGIYKLD